jgi:hypothetical protein
MESISSYAASASFKSGLMEDAGQTTARTCLPSSIFRPIAWIELFLLPEHALQKDILMLESTWLGALL